MECRRPIESPASVTASVIASEVAAESADDDDFEPDVRVPHFPPILAPYFPELSKKKKKAKRLERERAPEVVRTFSGYDERVSEALLPN